MEPKKHKRKIKRYLILTSNATNSSGRQIRVYPSVCLFLLLLLCGLTAAGVLYAAKKDVFDSMFAGQKEKQAAQLKDLEEKNQALEEEVKNLSSNVSALSETLQQKMDSEAKLQAQITEISLPTDFPLNRAASITEVTEGNPMCIFSASQGSFVTAAAMGTVVSVEDDAEYGHSVVIDHGNGYVTIYKNKGDVQVKAGDEIMKGMTLYIVGEENTSLGYQMMLEGNYINPMEMLAISG